MNPTRRTVLRGSLTAAAGLALPMGLSGCDLGFPVSSSQNSAGKLLPSKAALPEPFTTQLPIPPTLQPSHSGANADYYDITQRAEQMRILPNTPSTIWGYNGMFPGPTFHARSGRETVVRHRNELPVPTVVHLHGGRTPASSDGYPTDYVLPVEGYPQSQFHQSGEIHEGEFAYRYPLPQRASTLWYHDHRMDFTGPQVWRGLAGFFIVHDETEDALPLPRGERDIPLMITDRSFAADGALQYPARDPSLTGTPGVTEEFMSGVLGDCILVNGAPWPMFEVSNTRYRFRLLNASNARRYRLALDPAPDGSSFVQVGTGQGLLSAPAELDALEISQAERFDVIVDFSAYPLGTRINLRNEHGDGATGQVMQFVVAREEDDDSRIPDELGEIETLSEDDVVAEREFTFAKGGAERHGMTLWTVNGKPFDLTRIDARVRRGTTEKWTIRALNLPHPFHIHLDPFQVVSHGQNGTEGPGTYDRGWKDVINLDNGGRGSVLIRFDGYPGKYVFHCHNLEHEDMMMMANFEVV